MALADEALAEKFADNKKGLCKKIEKANAELKEVKYSFKCN
jgi:5-(carboxyamino)imidazole ribonucleotide mutase